MPTFQNRIVSVDLTGVADVQYLTVTLTNLIDSSGQAAPDVSATAGFLLGDANGDRSVNSGDVQQIRNRSGEGVNPNNAASYRLDLNSDGVINSGDATVARARSGNSLPP